MNIEKEPIHVKIRDVISIEGYNGQFVRMYSAS